MPVEQGFTDGFGERQNPVVQLLTNKPRQMPPESPASAPRPPVAQSRVTNGSCFLEGDQRTSGARRYRDICGALTREVDGEPGQQVEQTIRRIAGTSVAIERMEADLAGGQAVDPTALVRMVGLQRRLLKDFEALKQRKKSTAANPSQLREYLASRATPASDAPKGPGSQS